jgi:hypothetical protein
MSDSAELRLFAQVCRTLSEGARDPDDKASWLRLARKWQQMEAGHHLDVPVELRSPELYHANLPAN